MTTEEVQTIHWFILIMRLSAVVSGQTSDDYRGGSDHPLVHPDHDAIVISGQPSDDYRGGSDHPLVHPDHETVCCCKWATK